MSTIDFSEIPDPPIRVIFSGRVQGVGFRWTTSRIAKGFEIAGTVRNQADGTVELVVMGEREAVLDFLRALGRAMRENIDDFAATPAPEASDLFGFQILR